MNTRKVAWVVLILACLIALPMVWASGRQGGGKQTDHDRRVRG